VGLRPVLVLLVDSRPVLVLLVVFTGGFTACTCAAGGLTACTGGAAAKTEGEGVAEFIAGLRKLTEHCNFRETLDDMLRDRLVCGLNDEKIQRRLLAEPGLTYKRAVQLALAFESASKNTLDLKSKVETAPISVHQVNKHETPQECYRCGGRHNPSQCRFREVKCYNCDKKGHIEKMCRGQKQKAYHGHDQVNKRRTDNKAGSQPTHLLKESNTDEYTMYHMKGTTNAVLQPLEVDIELCGEPHKMEIDTGATKTIISETTYSELPENVKLVNSNAILSTYTGEKIPVIGKVTVPVKYGEQNHNLSALVVQGEGPNLLGRDWLHVIKLNWQTVFKVNEGNTKLAHVLETHNEVFKEGLGTLRGTEAKIYVDSNTQPRFVKARPVPYAMKEKIERELDRLVSEGILSPVEFSEWAAPIVPVLKPNGSIRICGDYKCTVNQVSKLDNYPIPKTEDLLATLGGGNKFTKLDMSQAYQQMTLDEQSKSYTTINTHKGLYQYNRLPFGISSAPGIFQRTMESLLQGIPHVIVRIDDILVSGKDDSDHIRNLETVLERLSKAGVKLRKEKCFFMQPEVIYCGYVINGDGIKPVSDKVEAIKHAPEPKDIGQLRAFLGMLNYYHRFLPDVSTVLEPLHKLLRKGEKWQWQEEQRTAFEKAKELLQSAELLVHFDPTKELILASDASNYGIGAVLSHNARDGSERPIGYVSRSLNTAERGYSTIEKEALAIVFGVKKFHQFLYGHKFTIKTDHKPLEGLFSEKKGVPQQASPRVQRWALTLAAYEYTISYKAGRNNENADALSRLPLAVAPDSVPQPGETIHLMEHLEGTTVNSQNIKDWTKRDPTLSQVLRYTLEGWPTTGNLDELVPYSTKKSELTVEDGCLLWGARVVIPRQGRQNMLTELHEAHPGTSRMKYLARSYVWWPGMDQDIENLVKRCNQCQLHQKTPAEAPLHPWEWPSEPWTRIHIDYAGPYKGEMFLVVVDACSKWLEVHLMNSTTSTATIEKLRETFANHGLPKTIVSDNGSNFTSAEFEQFTVKNGIKHIKVAPYHPASNGQAERAVRIFKEGFEKMEGGSIRTKLSRFLLRYRITPHSTTGVPPAQLLMKRHLRTQLDLVRPSVGDRVQTKQEQQKAIHDNHAKARDIQIDDPVYIRDFREKKAWLPGVVIEKTGPVSSKIELQDGTIVRRHQDHIRTTVNESKRPEPDIPEMPTLEDTPPEEMSPQEITPQATQTSSTPKP
ncbi:hypothetical protein QZH41_008960, partial [Actinostola sp. cb2023]